MNIVLHVQSSGLARYSVKVFVVEKVQNKRAPLFCRFQQNADHIRIYGIVEIGIGKKQKLPPEEGSALREIYSDIIPGYYCNKRHWNSIKADGEVPAELVSELAFKAYAVVFASLPKKVREAIKKG